MLCHGSICTADEAFETEPFAFHSDQAGVSGIPIVLYHTLVFKLDSALFNDIEFRRHCLKVKETGVCGVRFDLKLANEWSEVTCEEGSDLEVLVVDLVDLL